MMEDKITRLTQLDRPVQVCMKCQLCNSRTRVVFGAGNVNCYVMIVGEAPGEEEDTTGMPFMGRAGDKLIEIMSAVGYPRDQVFMTNAVKCRPPNNEVPTPASVSACNPYLQKQIEIIQPKVILTLGGTALNAVIQQTMKISQIRGRWLQTKSGTLVIPTFHPSHVIRSNSPETAEQFLTDVTAAFRRAYA